MATGALVYIVRSERGGLSGRGVLQSCGHRWGCWTRGGRGRRKLLGFGRSIGMEFLGGSRLDMSVSWGVGWIARGSIMAYVRECVSEPW